MATTTRLNTSRVARARSTRPAHTTRARKPAATKHEDKRTAILRTAAQLFAANGYESTSLDTIADQLGMHKATLYHYVDSKESILYECLVQSFSDLDEVVQRMEDRSVPVLQRLRLFARSLAHAQNNDFGRCQLLVGLRPLDSESGSDIRRFQKRLDDTVRALVTEGIADGSIKPCKPGLVAAMFFGSMNWVPRWYQATGKLTLEEVADAFVDIITQGIATTQR